MNKRELAYRIVDQFSAEELNAFIALFSGNNAVKDELPKASNSSAHSNCTAGTYSEDKLFENCGRLVVSTGKASIGTFQREFKIGFDRASGIMDQLEDAGIVSDMNCTKPRDVLMSEIQFEEYMEMLGG